MDEPPLAGARSYEPSSDLAAGERLLSEFNGSRPEGICRDTSETYKPFAPAPAARIRFDALAPVTPIRRPSDCVFSPRLPYHHDQSPAEYLSHQRAPSIMTLFPKRSGFALGGRWKLLLAISVWVQPGYADLPEAHAPSAAMPSVLPRSAVSPDATSAGLAWDAVTKEYDAKAGETGNVFTFNVANHTAAAIVIKSALPSCGCTLVQLPPVPWTLAPGEEGRIQASMDWRGRFGLFAKTILVETSAGPQILTLKIQIPRPREAIEIPIARARNLQIAATDRQAVFKNDCAKCHVEPTATKTGPALFAAACGICHGAEHRATMVPDLKALAQPTDRAFWRQWIEHGKAGSLMPAFAQAEGGPLSAAQIDSLVEYLTSTLSTRSEVRVQSPTVK